MKSDVTPIRRGILLALFLTQALPARAAVDTIRVGHPTNCTTVSTTATVVSIPVYLVDRAGTPVGSDVGGSGAIHSFSLRVRLTPTEPIAESGGRITVEWLRAGATASMNPISESTGSTSSTATWGISFDTPIPISLATTTRVGTLKIYLNPGIPSGTRIEVTVDVARSVTQISNADATVEEAVPGGNLSVMNGCILVQ